MENEVGLGILSLLPVTIALVLAFYTRNAIFSLLIGCLIGVILEGFDPATGFVNLTMNALGNRDFIWVMMIEVAVGIMIALYMRAGVIDGFTKWAVLKIKSRKSALGFAWLMGIFVFFSDYFSPLFSGPIARPLTDKYKVSREMLSYLLDSGSGPVCTIIPLSGWAVFIAGLFVGYGPIDSVEKGMQLFISAVPFNFYGWLAVIIAGLFAFQIIPHFGPMRKAERRAFNEGKVLRDGATPLTGEEFNEIATIKGKQPDLFVYLFLPVLIIILTAVGTFFVIGSAKILEAFLCAVIYMSIAMAFGKYFKGVKDAMEIIINGIKAVLPAILILAMAYCINSVSKSLGAQEYIIRITKSWMTPFLIPAAAFVTAGAISFFTGTSWGSYAIVIPFIMPIVFNMSGAAVNSLVLITVGALVGGGLFGDHCSPVSDTTCLSSFGAGADHMDHVSTQLPYAILGGIAAIALYILFMFLF
jgi:Na+/H+ antiporter NhaC